MLSGANILSGCSDLVYVCELLWFKRIFFISWAMENAPLAECKLIVNLYLRRL